MKSMRFFLVMLFVTIAHGVSAQRVAVKSNLLYGATATANLGFEVGLGARTTIDLTGSYNGWYIDKDTNHKINHFLVQPEFRYYLCEKMKGHFFGLHAHYSQYDVCGDHWLMSAFKELSSLRGVSSSGRYQGSGYGAGLSYGYNLMISSRFNIEFTLGAGYTYLDYDIYGTQRDAEYIKSERKDYIGITKAGISLVYIIK